VFLQRRQEHRQRQFGVFRVLMSTRASGLAPDHVQALNMIDVEFYGRGKTTRDVLEAWKAYLDHLNGNVLTGHAWATRRDDLLFDLLQKMGAYLGYHFDKTELRRTSYFPRGYGAKEWEQQQIRELALALLKGERSLPVCLPAPPVHDTPSHSVPKGDSPDRPDLPVK
jgi:hypothetical protein